MGEYSLKNALAIATKYTKPQPVSQLFSGLFDENLLGSSTGFLLNQLNGSDI
jgi:hypothetical protein